jgi:hypothetical protein
VDTVRTVGTVNPVGALVSAEDGCWHNNKAICFFFRTWFCIQRDRNTTKSNQRAVLFECLD